MFEDSTRTAGAVPPLSLHDSAAEAVTPSAPPPRPLVLQTFAPRARGPAYGWSSVFSIFLHVTLIGITLWLSRTATVASLEPEAVLFRRPPPPRPPPPAPAKSEAPSKGSRGVNLPKAVARDIQPEMELTFAAPTEEASGPTGRWVGGVGTGYAVGPGWSNGVEGGAIRRTSLAHGPQEVNTAWDCGFPPDGPPHNVVVRIRVHVSASGRPTHVSILQPGLPVFNESARECALRQPFRPAVDEVGNPCEGDREIGVFFFYPGGHDAAEAPRAPPPAPVAPPLEGPQPVVPVHGWLRL